MKVIGVIPSRYDSSRFPGKPLADICGKPMLWWVYQQALKVESIDDIVVATDSDLIVKTCQELGMNCMLTSDQHNTPTSRLYEVSTRMEGDKFVFIGGDEPLINPDAIDKVVKLAREKDAFAVNAMTKIKTMHGKIVTALHTSTTSNTRFCLIAASSTTSSHTNTVWTTPPYVMSA